ncbi:MAG: histidinol dehydrogenase [Ignavibacteriae bacterium]|nr:histidinol dehydrogenase [Ignavibacteria bacterium]MBI3365649.1 histidinol dehydrogenase [Ignavibacteriota bacterium]
MKIYKSDTMMAGERSFLCKRPMIDHDDILPTVRGIIEDVARNGDPAVRSYTQKYDGVARENLAISQVEIADSIKVVSRQFTEAVTLAARNIEVFHRAQLPQSLSVETAPGIVCRREWRTIDRVGLYVPGGSAPLVSTVLMLGIPARLAGCKEIILCTPPLRNGTVAPEILFAANHLGIERIVAVGGVQAIAAMACGTGSIPKVDKIFGPGNRFVAAAKLVIQQPPYNVAIDMLAGPSELLVIADETANPEWVAADLLSQAEHGEDSQVVLVTTSDTIVQRVQSAIDRQRAVLPRNRTIEKALEIGFTLVVNSVHDALEFANLFAPEHLSLAIKDAEPLIPLVRNAGSVFVGSLCSVVFGDYASGTNHTLPTNAAARAMGGISVESFMKPVSFQTVNRLGYSMIAESVVTLAQAEGLDAHANAVRVRRDCND